MAELPAFWLPDIDKLATYSPSLARAGRTYHITAGSSTAIHLCRAIHGFTMDMLAQLRVYANSYDAHPRPQDLHLCDWSAQLPVW